MIERAINVLRRTAARGLYGFSKMVYSLLRNILKPWVVKHPRLYRFAKSIKEPIKELLRSPVAVSKNGFPAGSVLPEWLIEEWKSIHHIEPILYPEKWLIDNMTFYLYDMPESAIGRHYPDLCLLCGTNVSHVFLVPWLLRGGSDLVTLNYVNALKSHDNTKNITVIATTDADSPWKERLPDGVRFVEFGKKYDHLSPEEQEMLLARVLLQMAPKVVHNINSDLGYRIYVKYGKALSSISNLYVSSFCIDLGLEGNFSGYPIWYLPKCFDYLKALFSDNQAHLNKLNKIYAFEMEKMRVHYQPIDFLALKATDQKVTEHGRLSVLWAGRLDAQKRPDILIQIAEKCLDLPISFHVYGSPVMSMDIYSKRFYKTPNIQYHGAFDGLYSLPIPRYDIFLYTSEWDGMPNVLLEAISLGLPVIAANVGGIAELIIDGETGFLIGPYDDINQYVECLKRLNNDRSSLPRVIENARSLVRKRHSRDMFVEILRREEDYM